ncbi:hypothetical protein WICPIJ_006221 [Wickerhamomyces pijperi]|uniref:Uncharacterized protein n=1 Tax=Wickerhamomyces pijperi TaxID=599730 RepID=A0A9P8Q447_WICPI|nr:hypothetical protein WICPIJ_006221 [Wickerhamomyces pijperi]
MDEFVRSKLFNPWKMLTKYSNSNKCNDSTYLTSLSLKTKVLSLFNFKISWFFKRCLNVKFLLFSKTK